MHGQKFQCAADCFTLFFLSFQELAHLVRLGQQVVLFDPIQLRHGLKALLFKECGIFEVED